MAKVAKNQVSTEVNQESESFKLYPVYQQNGQIMHHIYNLDINNDGVYKEIALVKKELDGSLKYINLSLLDNIDKARIVSIVTNVHADKYPLWELMSQRRLSNSINALDYFHQVTKTKLLNGSSTSGMNSSLINVAAASDTMVGTGFSDPSSSQLNM